MPDSDYTKIAQLLASLSGGNTVLNTAQSFLQPPAPWGDREGAIAQAVPMAGAAFTGGMPMATRGAAGMAGGRLGAHPFAEKVATENAATNVYHAMGGNYDKAIQMVTRREGVDSPVAAQLQSWKDSGFKPPASGG